MYSGITQGLFSVATVTKKTNLIHYSVLLGEHLLTGLEVGSSVNVDGVCQTVVSIKNNEIFFDAIEETLQLTTLSDLQIDRKVSIERSLRYGDEMGGHEVAGHVTGTAVVKKISRSEDNLTLTIQCPGAWTKYIFSKGFIAIDGSSLTVGEVEPQADQTLLFAIHLTPETIRRTNFGNKVIDSRVNIELDHKTRIIVDTVNRIMV